MKQVIIICNSEVTGTVEKTLSGAGIRGFAHLEGTGTNVVEKGPYSQDLTWPADVFIVPTEDALARKIVDELKGFAGQCREEPCLKVIVTGIEEFY